ncbi:MAG: tetratricopeptide repeat protein [Candidatus Odinarchaeota archaeon]
MEKALLFTESPDTITKIILKAQNHSFLVGAGISMDFPSNLPSARQIVRVLLESCAPEEEVEGLLTLEDLRYELLVETIQQFFDEELRFLEYLDLVTEPNVIHLFLANALARGNYVITTNFDYLIERALMKILPEKKHENILPVITKTDYRQYENPQQILSEKKYPVYKIHGSRSNIITGDDTKESLVTTISSLGRDRESGETFAIEPHKKPAVNNIMKDHSLIVLGYSGSDDFDIGPVLKEIPFLKQLIWVDHQFTDDIVTLMVNKVKNWENNKELTRLERLLLEIRQNVDFEVFLVKANTSSFVREVLWNSIVPDSIPPSIQEFKDLTVKNAIPDFKEWVEPVFKDADIVFKHVLAMRLFYELKQPSAVIRVSEKGLPLAEAENNIVGLGHFYNHLGLTYGELGEWDTSLEYHQKSLAIDEETNDLGGQAASYSGIGYIHYSRGNYAEALSFFEKAADIAEKSEGSTSLGHYLNNLGMLNKELGNTEEALEYLTRSLKFAEKIGDLNGKATVLSNIGLLYKTQMDYEKALEYYNEALRINQQLGNYRGIGSRLSHIGTIYFEHKNYSEARRYFEEGLQIFKALGDRANSARMMGNIAILHKIEGDYQNALTMYREILEMAKELRDQKAIAIRTNNIGLVYLEMKDYERAIECFNEALSIDRQIKNVSGEATDLNNMGTVYYRIKDMQKALHSYTESLKISEKIRNQELINVNLDNIRDVYEELADEEKDSGNYLEAVKLYKFSLKIEQDRNDLPNQAFYLNRIAVAYYFNDDNEVALEHLTKALEISKKINSDRKQSDNYYYIGVIKDEMNQTGEAIDAYKEALVLARKLEDKSDQILLLKKLGSAYQKLGNLQDAIETYNDLLPLLKEQKAEEDIAEIVNMIESLKNT